MPLFSYLFYPNPGNATYESPKVLILFAVCFGLVVCSFALRVWRGRLQNPVTKRLSRSWSSACLWFSVIGLVLIISRVEQISYVSMRFLWVLWAIVLLFYLFIQVKQFRARHYEQLPKETVEDPREKYLPKRKR